MNAGASLSSLPWAWLPWSTDAFQRAQVSGKPVLLALDTRWSSAARAAHARLFADPRVAARIAASYVPVRVDADRRPDIAERYVLGAWPTIAFLTPEGDLLGGGTTVDVDRLLPILDGLAERFARDRVALAIEAAAARVRASADVPEDDAVPDADEILLASLDRHLLDAYDTAHGGFHDARTSPEAQDTQDDRVERGAPVPQASPLLYALRRSAVTRDERLLRAATHTLDRLGWPEGDRDPDDVRGGVASGAIDYAAAHGDWTDRDVAWRLDDHAALVPVFIEAWTLTGHEPYGDRARAAIAFVLDTLGRSPRGLFAHSAWPLDASMAIDATACTDANARMIRTLLVAGAAFDRTDWAERAVHAAEQLLARVYERTAGLAHCVDLDGDPGSPAAASIRGLLGDQVYASAVLLDLADATGQRVYLDLADELMRACLRKMWDDRAGAFRDRVPTSAGANSVGLLAEPVHPFAVNAEAVRVLERLRDASDPPGAEARARDVRAFLRRSVTRQGVLAAEYGLLQIG